MLRAVLFLSYCYAVHRDLHSFPTRRSSDLATRASVMPLPLPEVFQPLASVSKPPLPTRFDETTTRPEDHAPELPSPVQLAVPLPVPQQEQGCSAVASDFGPTGSEASPNSTP